MRNHLTLLLFVLFTNCKQRDTGHGELTTQTASVAADTISTPIEKTVTPPYLYDSNAATVDATTTTPEELLNFAKTLQGIPYVFASADPKVGFDCSGFISYVFNHFNIAVPRSSLGFTDMKPQVSLSNAKPGDLILFTGTDTLSPEVGHIGIITANQSNKISFIHSTSGKAKGVTITPINKYYLRRFVKIISVRYKSNGK